MEWLRWYHGSCTDPKFRVVAKKAAMHVDGVRVSDVLAVWSMILERASKNESRGYFSGFDCEAADEAFGLPDGASFAILGVLESKEIIKDGRIVNWEKRQPKRERDDDSANRVKAYRERQKQTSKATCDDVTPCNAMKHDETHVTVNSGETFQNVGVHPNKQEIYKVNPMQNFGASVIGNQLNSNTCDGVTPCNAMQRQETPRGEEIRGDLKKDTIALPTRSEREFESFWQAYPRKKSKGHAQKTWDKLHKAKALPDLAVILNAIAAAKAGQDWQRDGGKFIPHPGTWLNNFGWEDEGACDLGVSSIFAGAL